MRRSPVARLPAHETSGRSPTSLPAGVATASRVDTAATVGKLLRLGWTLEDYESWIVQLLTLFLDPGPLA